MKRKNIIPFLGLLFVAPFLTAFGDASKDYDFYYSDYKADYVLLDTSDEAMNLYKITYENTGNYYLYDNSFIYGENKSEIMRENEPFNMPDIFIAPGEKETVYIELSKTTDIGHYVNYKSAYSTRDENVKIEDVSEVTLDKNNRYEGYEIALIECELTGLDEDFEYVFFINVSYQGREYNARCSRRNKHSLSVDISKNTNINDLEVKNIVAFKHAPKSSGGINIVALMLLIFLGPIAIVILIKILIVTIAVIAVKAKEKKSFK